MEIDTIDLFDETYKPDFTIKSEVMCPESQTGMLETYGKDFELVRKIYEQSPMRVWTAIDGVDGMYLVQGCHFVNRVYYMITCEPAKNEFEEYLIDKYEDEE